MLYYVTSFNKRSDLGFKLADQLERESQKVSEYDQEIPQSQMQTNSPDREEEPQDIYSNKTSERQ